MLNCAAVLGTLAAFVCIFVAKGAWTGPLIGKALDVYQLHSLFGPSPFPLPLAIGQEAGEVFGGFLCSILALSQPVSAAFRPAPETPKRPIFNILHRGVGVAAWLAGGEALFSQSERAIGWRVVGMCAAAALFEATHFDYLARGDHTAPLVRSTLHRLPPLSNARECEVVLGSLWGLLLLLIGGLELFKGSPASQVSSPYFRLQDSAPEPASTVRGGPLTVGCDRDSLAGFADGPGSECDGGRLSPRRTHGRPCVHWLRRFPSSLV